VKLESAELKFDRRPSRVKVPVTAVVLAKNEEVNIVDCVDSLRWADEVIVVDDDSTDRTAELARARGARVVQHRFESFAAQRNWAIDHAGGRNEWMLMLDADEMATDAFAAEVARKLATVADDVVAFRTCRKLMLDGVWLKHSDGFPVWIMRLVRRGKAYFEDSGHGEVPVPTVNGRIGTIHTPFLHEAFRRGMDDWWMRHVRYAGREALREHHLNRDARLSGLLSLDSSRRRRALRSLARRLPFRGPLRFLYQYILGRGFLDGATGLRFCRMMACYESMIAIRKSEPTLESHRGDQR
jgi:glycosyltransferase involved in cell wall biosynthesis